MAERLPYDHIRVRIAIADVDGMVGKDSATDGHAGHSTTSVYAGPFVFPMLPERLSTDLTSLNPGEDRGAIVVEMDVGPGGAVVRHDVYRALVHSRAKLAYDAVGSWLEGGTTVPPEVFAVPGLEEQVRLQDEAAQRLRALRRRHGLLDLETIEARPVIAGGKVIDLEVPPHDRARDIIENLMIAANVAMARFLKTRRVASLRRVVRTRALGPHRRPGRGAGRDLPASRTPRPWPVPGPPQGCRSRTSPRPLAGRREAAGPGEYVLERRLSRLGRALRPRRGRIRAFHRAQPALRRPRHAAAGQGVLDGTRPNTRRALMAIAARCTEREDAARKVERTVRKSVAAALVHDRIGERFTAIITGASEKGTYVRVLRPPIEGRVVRGAQGLDVGDTVRVKLIGADPERGFVDFEGPASDVGRKIARSRRRRRRHGSRRIGRQFAAVVTAPSEGDLGPAAHGAGRRARRARAARPRRRETARHVAVDPVHGFIDFEYGPGVDSRKSSARRARRPRPGACADAWERASRAWSRASPRATYAHRRAEAEGRIVAARPASVGEPVRRPARPTEARLPTGRGVASASPWQVVPFTVNGGRFRPRGSGERRAYDATSAALPESCPKAREFPEQLVVLIGLTALVLALAAWAHAVG